jgi:hypothetical protein
MLSITLAEVASARGEQRNHGAVGMFGIRDHFASGWNHDEVQIFERKHAEQGAGSTRQHDRVPGISSGMATLIAPVSASASISTLRTASGGIRPFRASSMSNRFVSFTLVMVRPMREGRIARSPSCQASTFFPVLSS